MRTLQTEKKYIEWRSPEELHDATLNWISELKFIKDEQHFLDTLITNYTLELIEKKTFETSNKIVKDLSSKRKTLEIMLKKVIVHYNNLELLIDGVNESKKEKKYKEDHYKFAVEVSNYFNAYKETKKNIFELIKGIIKKNKQKRLLN